MSGTTYYLGVGTSTEQIVGGWHRVAYDATITGTRERLTRLRAILDGERRGSFALPNPPAIRSRTARGPGTPGGRGRDKVAEYGDPSARRASLRVTDNT